jgi:hypothetical protein
MNFAAALRTYDSVITRVLHGAYPLTPKREQQWADLLDSSVEDLFGDEKDMQS